jgi:hypothetical protein
VKIQSYEDDMKCPACGPYPDTVIWDGVTLAYGRKHILSSLQPPTFSHQDAKNRSSRYFSKQQLIPTPDVRKLLRKVIVGCSCGQMAKLSGGLDDMCDGDDLDDDEIVDQDSVDPNNGKMTQELLSRVNAIPELLVVLTKINKDLGNMFGNYFGLDKLLARPDVPREYRRLFIQVSV